MAFYTEPICSSSGSLVKVSSTDSTADYLYNKLVAGTNITLTKNSVFGYETITIDSSGGGGGGCNTLNHQTISGVIDGSNTTFTIPVAIAGKSIIDLSGQTLVQDIHYSIAGTVITYFTAPSILLSGKTHQLIHVGFASGTSISFEAASGAIDGTNVTYTVLNDPDFIVTNGRRLYEGFGYTLAGLTITMDVPPDPGSYVFSAYNSTEIVEIPTGAVDGVNVSYIVTHVPDFVVLSGMMLFEGFGYSRSGFNITMDVAPSTGEFFVSIAEGNSSFETPTGTIDGTNNIFTPAHSPTYIVVNQTMFFNGYGYVYSLGEIITDIAPSPGSWIISSY